MSLIFKDISAKGGAGSTFLHQLHHQQIMSSIETSPSRLPAAPAGVKSNCAITYTATSTPSIPSTPSPLSSSCDSGVALSDSSLCSSINNSPILCTSATAVNIATSSSSSAHVVNGVSSSDSVLAIAYPSDLNQQLSCGTTVNSPLISTSTSATIQASEVNSTILLSTTPSSSFATVVTTAGIDSVSSSSEFLLNGIASSGCANNINSHQLITEDPRALQLALELSMVGLSDESTKTATTVSYLHQQQQLHPQKIQTQSSQNYDLSALEAISAAVNAAASVRAYNIKNNIRNNSEISNNSNGGGCSNVGTLNQFSTSSTSLGLPPSIEDRSKKSQNMTECVPVPSSEHVAEIVGRQGCKIKALRAKTNTYIKTPVRGEEPVFVVTGRKEDVTKAKREIHSAAEHFSLIRATRKPSVEGSYIGNINGINGECGKTPLGPPSIPGHVTIQVRVPYRVVGLVVGPKGATIKHIQQETQTYIVTPSREKQPIFEVTGLPDNVQSARKQIEAHIAIRTGNLAGGASGPVPALPDAVTSVHTINTLSQILNEEINPDFLASIYKNGICSGFEYLENVGSGAVCSGIVSSNTTGININVSKNCNNSSNQLLMSSIGTCNNNFINTPQSNEYLNSIMGADADGIHHINAQYHQLYAAQTHVDNIIFNNVNNAPSNTINLTAIDVTGTNMMHGTSINTNGMTRSCSSASSTTSSKSTNNSGGSSRPELVNIWKNLGDSVDVDEGIGESPSIWTLPTSFAALAGSHHCSPSTSISPTDSLLGEIGTNPSCNGLNYLMAQLESTNKPTGTGDCNQILQQQLSALQSNMPMSSLRRECLVCSNKKITAALVPCGHNMFCMECANRICTSGDGICPVCNQTVYHAMRILA